MKLSNLLHMAISYLISASVSAKKPSKNRYDKWQVRQVSKCHFLTSQCGNQVTLMERILLEILHELKSHRAATTEIWNVDDIARYIRLSRSSVQSRIICRADFPRAVRIPTESGLGGRRWYSKEVKYWIAKNREPVS